MSSIFCTQKCKIKALNLKISLGIKLPPRTPGRQKRAIKSNLKTVFLGVICTLVEEVHAPTANTTFQLESINKGLFC